MTPLIPTISCNLDKNLLATALPLLQAGDIGGIEWSFDSLYQSPAIPAWYHELLLAFASEGRLIGHGVFFSIFSGKWLPEHDQWLKTLKKTAQTYSFDHISEHFGFMTGAHFHKGAPMGVPFTAATLALGRDRLMRIQDACQCPVGLENLAFAYSLDAVKAHGAFLDKLVEPVNGFLILDLHNMYCQVHNFEVDADELLGAFPLERVREIHISGGSLEKVPSQPGKLIRRDTHDDAVPEEVFALLQKAIPQCPNLKFVTLEQMGIALPDAPSQTQFHQDFQRMKSITDASPAKNPANSFLPNTTSSQTDLTTPPLSDLQLWQEQLALSEILENAVDVNMARQQMELAGLSANDWQTDNWPDAMLETAMAISQKWKNGFQ